MQPSFCSSFLFLGKIGSPWDIFGTLEGLAACRMTLFIDDRVARKVNELVLEMGGAGRVVLRRQVRLGRLNRV
jgi:hypothetical protein